MSEPKLQEPKPRESRRRGWGWRGTSWREPSWRGPVRMRARHAAWLVSELATLGIERREHGSCLGVDLARLVCELTGQGASSQRGPDRYAPRAVRAAVAHARSGHDVGCMAFGVSIAELRRLLGDRLPNDAWMLIEEALDDAAVDIMGDLTTRRVGGGEARDLVALHLARRLTPSPME